MKILKLNQAGDTIVEVLIGMAVMTTIMGISYGLATRSLRGARVSQDRTVALKLAEGQVERLKYIARTTNNFDATYRTTTPDPGNFCFGTTTHARTINSVPLTTYNDECKANTYFRINISYAAITLPAPNAAKPYGNYNVYVEWDSLSRNVENLTISYQL